jgi:hypothetical protein
MGYIPRKASSLNHAIILVTEDVMSTYRNHYLAVNVYMHKPAKTFFGWQLPHIVNQGKIRQIAL